MIKFQISILKYRHSYFLGEEINIGILLFFEEDNSLDFLYPKSLQRISALYPDFSYSTLRKYLHSFDRQSKYLSRKLKKNADQLKFKDIHTQNLLKQLIPKYYIKNESSTLFFTGPEEGVHDFEKEKVVDYYYNQYLSSYESDDKRVKKDERYILSRIKNSFNKHKDDIKNSFIEDLTIENDFFTEKFDYGWKNGSTNLITPIGFDLKEEGSLREKGYKWRGKLSSFSGFALENNYRFDLVVSRPSSKSLVNSYTKVIQLIQENETPIKVIEETEIENYISKISIINNK